MERPEKREVSAESAGGSSLTERFQLKRTYVE